MGRFHTRYQFPSGRAADGGDVHQLLALGDCRVSPYLSPLISVPVRFVIGYRIQSSFIAPLLARDNARADERRPAADPQAGARAGKSQAALFHVVFMRVRIPISPAML